VNLRELYSKNKSKPTVSFEVFPPKDDFDSLKVENLFKELSLLKEFNPSLISVTYGAGGSNRNQSLDIIKRIKNELAVIPMPHFTCVSTNKIFIKEYLEEIETLGIKNILALRGDIPEQGQIYDDFKYASDLVHYIKSNSNLSVAVAGYPEGHKEDVLSEDNIKYLKLKVDNGADVVYTQLFFNNDCFYSYAEECIKNNINIPIIPGIMPITSYNSIQKMKSLCSFEIPNSLYEKIEAHKDDGDYIKNLGIDYVSKQCEDLIANNVKGLHFYTLNKSNLVSKILTNLNIG